MANLVKSKSNRLNYLSPNSQLSLDTMRKLTRDSIKKHNAVGFAKGELKSPYKDWMHSKVKKLLTLYTNRKIYSSILDSPTNMRSFILVSREHILSEPENLTSNSLRKYVDSYVSSIAKRQNRPKKAIAQELIETMKKIEIRIRTASREIKLITTQEINNSKTYFDANTKDAFSQILTLKMSILPFFSEIIESIQKLE
ncbi:MAG: hypothetical protein PHQ98_03640 [Candidatus ainarchaeum sp.]|nr:hypothetical protein [Candidatus ainarchaeum sp.]